MFSCSYGLNCVFLYQHKRIFNMGASLNVETKHEKYLDVFYSIRAKNFSNNLPFLILSNKLPKGQVYKEYSDGRIEVQQISSFGKKISARVLKTLNVEEAEIVRREYGLF